LPIGIGCRIPQGDTGLPSAVRPLGARLYPPRWPARLCRPPQDGPRQPLTAISAQDNDAQRVIAATHGVVGFFGASSMERLPPRWP